MNKALVFAFVYLFALTACSSAEKQNASSPSDSIPTQPVAQAESARIAPLDSIPADTIPPDTFPVEMLIGKIQPGKDTSFAKIAQQYTTKSGIYMRKEAYAAFKKMHAAAKADGVNLKIVSATRPFWSQMGIWERKWTGATRVEGQNLATEVPDVKERALKILRFSSMPGTSRHHWGTDIDLNNLNNSYFATGTGKKMYDWLVANASTYGFCQVYSPKDEKRPDGYQEEKWHWSYIPVSKKLTNLYKEKIKNGDIKGFEGAESAEMIDVVQKYVLGINQDCM